MALTAPKISWQILCVPRLVAIVRRCAFSVCAGEVLMGLTLLGDGFVLWIA